MWGSARFVYNAEKISHRENLIESGYISLEDFEFYNILKFCGHEKVPLVWFLVITFADVLVKNYSIIWYNFQI